VSTVVPSEFHMSALRVAFVGGGSGGHLFPAIAIADELLSQNAECHFLFLTSHRMVDRRVLESSNLSVTQTQVAPYVQLSSQSGIFRAAARLPSLWRSLRQARKKLQSFQPDVVVGLGAMASVPGVVAADRLSLPIVLLEQNCLPGRATHFLARRAKFTVFGLPVSDELTHNWPSQFRTCGTPVRAEIRDLAGVSSPNASSRRRLLILGGSQGSHSVNQIAADALCSGIQIPSDWEIVHQTGDADVMSLRDRYRQEGFPVRVEAFLPDVGRELATAGLVISRAGAVTLQELACAGVPTILIPLSTAADNHQWLNAKLLERSGAAILVDENQANARIFCGKAIGDLVSNEALRHRMAESIRGLATPQATKEIIRLLIEVASGGKQ